jgi:hypothetical protein
MSRKRWPTVQEVIADAERGIIDETTILVRPSPEEREALRAAAEAALAERRAARQHQPPARTHARRPA